MKIFQILIFPLFLSAIGALAQAPTAPVAASGTTSNLSQHDQQWAQLEKYRDADTKLGPPVAGEKRVVFFGDSITEGWRGADFFPGKNYINRGISGQTTTQMLMRFPQDVIALHPAVVTILAGTNDIAQNQGPITLEAIEANLESMAEMALKNGIRPILCSVLPVLDFGWHKGLQPAEKIRRLNSMMEAYCARAHVSFVNYYPALADGQGGMRPEFSRDGVHPNGAGYPVMAPMAEASIEQALGAP
jgi:lysophospholipase L1-like esterase